MPTSSCGCTRPASIRRLALDERPAVPGPHDGLRAAEAEGPDPGQGRCGARGGGRQERDPLAPKPASLSFEQAAAIPISGLTPLQGLRDTGKVQPGQKVLIIGAAGGVGTFAVQLAKAFGAHVAGVCSTSKADLVQSIGADD